MVMMKYATPLTVVQTMSNEERPIPQSDVAVSFPTFALVTYTPGKVHTVGVRVFPDLTAHLKVAEYVP